MTLFLKALFLIWVTVGVAWKSKAEDSVVILSCSFENDTCGMVNQVGMRGKWIRSYLEAGGRKGTVMSVKTSDDKKQTARLVGPYFESHRQTSGCLSFDFYISGEGASMFRVEEQTDEGFQKLLSVRTQLPHWRRIDLPVRVPESVRFLFEAHVNTGLGLAVVAVDNIIFKLGNCS